MSMIHPKIEAHEKSALRRISRSFASATPWRCTTASSKATSSAPRVFRGTVIKRHRSGARSTFTVRKVSFSVGVERIFMLHSPRIEQIDVVSRGVVRQARLGYLRSLQGKAARIRDEKDV